MKTCKAKYNILVTIDMAHLPESRKILESAGNVDYRPKITRQVLQENIKKYHAIVTNLQQRIDEKVLANASNLKLIATPSTGTDHIDISAAEEKGINVQSLKNDYDILKNITSTAEHAFALIMSVLRKIPQSFEKVKQGCWTRNEFRGREVQGRVLGIVGYGRLGEIISRFANAFEMRVIACDPNKKITDNWVEQVSFEKLLQKSEIISLHLHLEEKTRGLLGKKEFALMQDGVYLVNTSRGAIIDEAALLEALESGKVAAAGLDVLADELDGNISENPLVQYAKENDNLVITPHIGGCTYDAQEKAFSHMAKKATDFLKNS